MMHTPGDEVGRQITVYYDEDGPDLKAQIARLAKRRESPYFKRSESAIAAMLLQERIEELLNPTQSDQPSQGHGAPEGPRR